MEHLTRALYTAYRMFTGFIKRRAILSSGLIVYSFKYASSKETVGSIELSLAAFRGPDGLLLKEDPAAPSNSELFIAYI